MPENIITSLEECDRNLDIPLKNGAMYADLKLYVEHGSQIALRATSSDAQVFERIVGVARVIYGKAWGIHVIENPTKSSLKDACSRALKLARVADSTSILEKPITLAEAKQVTREVVRDCKVDPLTVEVEQKITFTKDIARRAESALKDSYGWCEVVYGDTRSDFSLINSEKTYIHEITPTIDLLVFLAARSGAVIESAGRFLGYSRGYEAIEQIERDKLVREIAERALKLVSGRSLSTSLQGNKLTVVMDSECSGALIHEAVGHPAEADFMLEAGSPFENKLGKQVAVKELTVYDDATIPGQYGTYSFDDEAVESRKICLIDDGVLKFLLHTRETAAEMNTQPTGSAHGLAHVPRCLMSNIYAEPRDWKQEELIEETRNGLYIQGIIKAQSNPVEGLFMIQPESATVIRNGELQETIRGVRIAGKAGEALRAIDGIGNRLTMRATVEKEFNISDGSPPLRVASLTIQ
nr:TldD/PmbA family protein [Candidatus Njordarchaeota archaeon]